MGLMVALVKSSCDSTPAASPCTAVLQLARISSSPRQQALTGMAMGPQEEARFQSQWLSRKDCAAVRGMLLCDDAGGWPLLAMHRRTPEMENVLFIGGPWEKSPTTQTISAICITVTWVRAGPHYQKLSDTDIRNHNIAATLLPPVYLVVVWPKNQIIIRPITQKEGPRPLLL